MSCFILQLEMQMEIQTHADSCVGTSGSAMHATQPLSAKPVAYMLSAPACYPEKFDVHNEYL